MSLTISERTTVTASLALVAGGLTLGAHGVIHSNASRSLGGTCLVTTALTLIGLTLIHHWVVDARFLRTELVKSLCESEAERRKYVALQGALAAEAARLRRDVNEQRSKIAAALYAEREAMHREFEEKRLQVAGEAFRTGVQMERSGMLKPDEPAVIANLIPFPEQGQGARAAEHQRSREHGVVGP